MSPEAQRLQQDIDRRFLEAGHTTSNSKNGEDDDSLDPSLMTKPDVFD